MLEFENLNEESKIIFLLSLSELALCKLEEPIQKELAEKSIQTSWVWFINKEIGADQLYYLLENMEHTGLLDYMMLKDFNKNNEEFFSCIAEGVAYITYKAYKYEGQEYLPQTIESVDNDTIEDFINNFKKVNNDISLPYKLIDYLLKLEKTDILDKINDVKLF